MGKSQGLELEDLINLFMSLVQYENVASHCSNVNKIFVHMTGGDSNGQFDILRSHAS